MNYSEELTKIVDKKNFTAVNAMILHLRHTILSISRSGVGKKYDRNKKRVFVFSLRSHLFQTQIELPG
jgi:hypothetical protein